MMMHIFPNLTRLAFATLPALLLSLLNNVEAYAKSGDVSHFELANGLELVVIENHRSPALMHMVWYPVGAADEAQGQSGVAHYLEHLMFKGTNELEEGEFSRIVSEQGGQNNAFTSWDYTAYFQRVAADRLELMMTLEADRMANLQLDREGTETEKNVVIEERGEVVDSNPGAVFQEAMRATLYRNHPYGRPIIGWAEEMEKLDLEAALGWYDRYYGPDHALVVVAGDVNPDEALAYAEKTYGQLPSRGFAPAEPRPQEPPHRSQRRVIYEDPRVGQEVLMRHYAVPSRRSGAQEDAASLTLLASLLGGSPTTSLLARELQLDTRIATYTAARYRGLTRQSPNMEEELLSSFSISIVPQPEISLEDAEKALDEALENLRRTGPDPEQLERIKFQLRAGEIFEQDSVRGLAYRYGEGLSLGLTLEDIEEWPERLQEVSPEDIQNALEWLQLERSVTGYLMPQQES